MLNYVIFTVSIDFLVLVCMISMIAKNQVMDFKQRAGFIASFVLILIVSFLELIALLIDDKFNELRILNLFFINTYLILSPLVPIIYAGALSGYKHKSFKYALGLYGLYFIFVILAIPFKLIFSIDSNNHYSTANGYPVFIVAYALFKIYLIYMCYVKVKRFQNTNWFGLIVLLIGFIGGSGVQLYDSTIHTVWACLTLILVVYYAYYNELCRQLDEMTDMYSHQAYLSKTSRMKIGEALIIMDCDNFKNLNDTYGHAEGDKCLIELATIIKRVFIKNGICYRIGGDEFAVVVYKDKPVKELIDSLARELKLAREKNPILPNLSIGYKVYDGTTKAQEFKNMADKAMYDNKFREAR